MELHLAQFSGPEDILTPLTADDESLRKQLGAPGPQNYATDTTKFHNHMPATDIIAALGEKLWRRYFTFTIERNPWDKVVSAYHFHRKRRGFDLSFTDYVRTWDRLPLNLPLYADAGGNVLVNRVFRYEDLAGAVSELALRFGWPAQDGLNVRAKGHFRTGGEDYRIHYDDVSREQVRRIFRAEIDLLGYEF